MSSVPLFFSHDGQVSDQNNSTFRSHVHAQKTLTVSGEMETRSSVLVGTVLTVSGDLLAKKAVDVCGQAFFLEDVRAEGSLYAKSGVVLGRGRGEENLVEGNGSLAAFPRTPLNTLSATESSLGAFLHPDRYPAGSLGAAAVQAQERAEVAQTLFPEEGTADTASSLLSDGTMSLPAFPFSGSTEAVPGDSLAVAFAGAQAGLLAQSGLSSSAARAKRFFQAFDDARTGVPVRVSSNVFTASELTRLFSGTLSTAGAVEYRYAADEDYVQPDPQDDTNIRAPDYLTQNDFYKNLAHESHWNTFKIRSTFGSGSPVASPTLFEVYLENGTSVNLSGAYLRLDYPVPVSLAGFRQLNLLTDDGVADVIDVIGETPGGKRFRVNRFVTEHEDELPSWGSYPVYNSSLGEDSVETATDGGKLFAYSLEGVADASLNIVDNATTDVSLCHFVYSSPVRPLARRVYFRRYYVLFSQVAHRRGVPDASVLSRDVFARIPLGGADEELLQKEDPEYLNYFVPAPTDVQKSLPRIAYPRLVLRAFAVFVDGIAHDRAELRSTGTAEGLVLASDGSVRVSVPDSLVPQALDVSALEFTDRLSGQARARLQYEPLGDRLVLRSRGDIVFQDLESRRPKTIRAGNLILDGSLTVLGTSTRVDICSNVVRVADRMLELGYGSSPSVADGLERGLLLHYGDGTALRRAFVGLVQDPDGPAGAEHFAMFRKTALTADSQDVSVTASGTAYGDLHVQNQVLHGNQLVVGGQENRFRVKRESNETYLESGASLDNVSAALYVGGHNQQGYSFKFSDEGLRTARDVRLLASNGSRAGALEARRAELTDISLSGDFMVERKVAVSADGGLELRSAGASRGGILQAFSGSGSGSGSAAAAGGLYVGSSEKAFGMVDASRAFALVRRHEFEDPSGRRPVAEIAKDLGATGVGQFTIHDVLVPRGGLDLAGQDVSAVGSLRGALAVFDEVRVPAGGQFAGPATGLTGVPAAQVTGTLPMDVFPAGIATQAELDAVDARIVPEGRTTQAFSTAALTVSGPILPTSTASKDLGSPTKKFRDLYLSGEIAAGTGNIAEMDVGAQGLFVNRDANTSSTVLDVGGKSSFRNDVYIQGSLNVENNITTLEFVQRVIDAENFQIGLENPLTNPRGLVLRYNDPNNEDVSSFSFLGYDPVNRQFMIVDRPAYTEEVDISGLRSDVSAVSVTIRPSTYAGHEYGSLVLSKAVLDSLETNSPSGILRADAGLRVRDGLVVAAGDVSLQQDLSVRGRTQFHGRVDVCGHEEAFTVEGSTHFIGPVILDTSLDIIGKTTFAGGLRVPTGVPVEFEDILLGTDVSLSQKLRVPSLVLTGSSPAVRSSAGIRWETPSTLHSGDLDVSGIMTARQAVVPQAAGTASVGTASLPFSAVHAATGTFATAVQAGSLTSTGSLAVAPTGLASLRGGLEVSGNLLPVQGSASRLGSSARPWAELHQAGRATYGGLDYLRAASRTDVSDLPEVLLPRLRVTSYRNSTFLDETALVSPAGTGASQNLLGTAAANAFRDNDTEVRIFQTFRTNLFHEAVVSVGQHVTVRFQRSVFLDTVEGLEVRVACVLPAEYSGGSAAFQVLVSGELYRSSNFGASFEGTPFHTFQTLSASLSDSSSSARVFVVTPAAPESVRADRVPVTDVRIRIASLTFLMNPTNVVFAGDTSITTGIRRADVRVVDSLPGGELVVDDADRFLSLRGERGIRLVAPNVDVSGTLNGALWTSNRFRLGTAGDADASGSVVLQDGRAELVYNASANAGEGRLELRSDRPVEFRDPLTSARQDVRLGSLFVDGSLVVLGGTSTLDICSTVVRLGDRLVELGSATEPTADAMERGLALHYGAGGSTVRTAFVGLLRDGGEDRLALVQDADVDPVANTVAVGTSSYGTVEAGRLRLRDSRVDTVDGNPLQVVTSDGTVSLGATSSSYALLQTDRPEILVDNPVRVAGSIVPYGGPERDLGSAAEPFRNAFLAGDVSANAVRQETLTVHGATAFHGTTALRTAEVDSARASSTLEGTAASHVIDGSASTLWSSGEDGNSNSFYAPSTGNYIGSTSTTVGGSSISGEWIEVRLGGLARLESLTVRAVAATASARSPRDFVVAGSIEGSTWTSLGTFAAVQDWDGDERVEKSFALPGGLTATSYRYVRLIVQKIGNQASGASSQDYLEIAQLSVGRVTAYEIDGVALASHEGGQAVLNREDGFAEGLRLQGPSSFSGGPAFSQYGLSARGPGGLTAVATETRPAVASVARSSGSFSVLGGSWQSASGTYESTGDSSTTAGATTSYRSGGVEAGTFDATSARTAAVLRGEWAEVTFAGLVRPVTLVLDSASTETARLPRTFALLGSRDGGSTWHLVYSSDAEARWGSLEAGVTEISYPLGDLQTAYSSFRLVVTAIGASATNGSLAVSSWNLVLTDAAVHVLGGGIRVTGGSSSMPVLDVQQLAGDFGRYAVDLARAAWSASSSGSGSSARHLSDSSVLSWTSAGSRYTALTGTYAGSSSTSFTDEDGNSGQAVAGEWVEVSLADQPFVLGALELRKLSGSDETATPGAWTLLASDDLPTVASPAWTRILRAPTHSFSRQADRVRANVPSRVPAAAYRRYRLVVESLVPGASTGTAAGLREILLFADRWAGLVAYDGAVKGASAVSSSTFVDASESLLAGESLRVGDASSWVVLPAVQERAVQVTSSSTASAAQSETLVLDASGATVWMSAAGRYSSSTGVYAGSQKSAGAAYAGEYVQLSLSLSEPLSGVLLQGHAQGTGRPAEVYVLGSQSSSGDAAGDWTELAVPTVESLSQLADGGSLRVPFSPPNRVCRRLRVVVHRIAPGAGEQAALARVAPLVSPVAFHRDGPNRLLSSSSTSADQLAASESLSVAPRSVALLPTLLSEFIVPAGGSTALLEGSSTGSSSWSSAADYDVTDSGSYTGSTSTSDDQGGSHAGDYVEWTLTRAALADGLRLTSGPDLAAQARPASFVLLGREESGSGPWHVLLDVSAADWPLAEDAVSVVWPVTASRQSACAGYRLVLRRASTDRPALGTSASIGLSSVELLASVGTLNRTGWTERGRQLLDASSGALVADTVTASSALTVPPSASTGATAAVSRVLVSSLDALSDAGAPDSLLRTDVSGTWVTAADYGGSGLPETATSDRSSGGLDRVRGHWAQYDYEQRVRVSSFQVRFVHATAARSPTRLVLLGSPSAAGEGHWNVLYETGASPLSLGSTAQTLTLSPAASLFKVFRLRLVLQAVSDASADGRGGLTDWVPSVTAADDEASLVASDGDLAARTADVQFLRFRDSTEGTSPMDGSVAASSGTSPGLGSEDQSGSVPSTASWTSSGNYGSTGAYTGSASTVLDDGSTTLSGEWIEAAFREPVALSELRLQRVAGSLTEAPRRYAVVASNAAEAPQAGTPWTLLFQRGLDADYASATGLHEQPVAEHSSRRFRYYRLVVLSLFSAGTSNRAVKLHHVGLGKNAEPRTVLADHRLQGLEEVAAETLRADTVELPSSSSSSVSSLSFSASSTSAGHASWLETGLGAGWTSATGVYSSSTGKYTGSVSTSGTSGEYVELAYQRPVWPATVTLSPHATDWATQSPRSLALFGSQDGGTSWTLLAERSGLVLASGSDALTLPVPAEAVSAFPGITRLRLVVREIGPYNDGTAGDTAARLRKIVVTDAGLRSGAAAVLGGVSLSGDLRTRENVDVSGTLTVGGDFALGATRILAVAASAVSSTETAYEARPKENLFDGNPMTIWSSNNTYTAAGLAQDGTSPETTDAAGRLYRGEYAQVDLGSSSSPAAPAVLRLRPRRMAATSNATQIADYRSPRDFVLLGSATGSGTDWTAVLSQTDVNAGWSSRGHRDFALDLSFGGFRYYRLVATRIARPDGGTAYDSDALDLAGLELLEGSAASVHGSITANRVEAVRGLVASTVDVSSLSVGGRTVLADADARRLLYQTRRRWLSADLPQDGALAVEWETPLTDPSGSDVLFRVLVATDEFWSEYQLQAESSSGVLRARHLAGRDLDGLAWATASRSSAQHDVLVVQGLLPVPSNGTSPARYGSIEAFATRVDAAMGEVAPEEIHEIRLRTSYASSSDAVSAWTALDSYSADYVGSLTVRQTLDASRIAVLGTELVNANRNLSARQVSTDEDVRVGRDLVLTNVLEDVSQIFFSQDAFDRVVASSTQGASALYSERRLLRAQVGSYTGLQTLESTRNAVNALYEGAEVLGNWPSGTILLNAEDHRNTIALEPGHLLGEIPILVVRHNYSKYGLLSYAFPSGNVASGQTGTLVFTTVLYVTLRFRDADGNVIREEDLTVGPTNPTGAGSFQVTYSRAATPAQISFTGQDSSHEIAYVDPSFSVLTKELDVELRALRLTVTDGGTGVDDVLSFHTTVEHDLLATTDLGVKESLERTVLVRKQGKTQVRKDFLNLSEFEEIQLLDGVTSNVQTQLDGKAGLAGSSSQNFAASTLTASVVSMTGLKELTNVFRMTFQGNANGGPTVYGGNAGSSMEGNLYLSSGANTAVTNSNAIVLRHNHNGSVTDSMTLTKDLVTVQRPVRFNQKMTLLNLANAYGHGQTGGVLQVDEYHGLFMRNDHAGTSSDTFSFYEYGGGSTTSDATKGFRFFTGHAEANGTDGTFANQIERFRISNARSQFFTPLQVHGRIFADDGVHVGGTAGTSSGVKISNNGTSRLSIVSNFNDSQTLELGASTGTYGHILLNTGVSTDGLYIGAPGITKHPGHLLVDYQTLSPYTANIDLGQNVSGKMFRNLYLSSTVNASHVATTTLETSGKATIGNGGNLVFRGSNGGFQYKNRGIFPQAALASNGFTGNSPNAYLLLGRFQGLTSNMTSYMTIHNERFYHRFFLSGGQSTNTPANIQYLGGAGPEISVRIVSSDANGQSYDEMDYVVLQFASGVSMDYDVNVDVLGFYREFEFADRDQSSTGFHSAQEEVTIGTPRGLDRTTFNDALEINSSGTITVGSATRYDIEVSTDTATGISQLQDDLTALETELGALETDVSALQVALPGKAALAGSSSQDFATKSLAASGSLSVTGNRRMGSLGIEFAPFSYNGTNSVRYYLLETPVEVIDDDYVGPYYVHVKMVPIVEASQGPVEFDMNLYNGGSFDPYSIGWFSTRSFVAHKGKAAPTVFTYVKGDPSVAGSNPKLCILLDFGDANQVGEDTVVFVTAFCPTDGNYDESIITRVLAGSPSLSGLSSKPVVATSGSGFYNEQPVDTLSRAVHADGATGPVTAPLVPTGSITKDRLVRTNFSTGQLETTSIRVPNGDGNQYIQTDETNGFYFSEVGKTNLVDLRAKNITATSFSGSGAALTSLSSRALDSFSMKQNQTLTDEVWMRIAKTASGTAYHSNARFVLYFGDPTNGLTGYSLVEFLVSLAFQNEESVGITVLHQSGRFGIRFNGIRVVTERVTNAQLGDAYLEVRADIGQSSAGNLDVTCFQDPLETGTWELMDVVESTYDSATQDKTEFDVGGTRGLQSVDRINAQAGFAVNGTTVVEDDRDIVNVKDITFTGTATGSGSGLTALNASNLSSGTVADARLPTTQAGKTFTSGLTIGTGSTDGVLTLNNNAKIQLATSNKQLRIENNNGYVLIGSQNLNYCHILTNRPAFYFDSPLEVNGNLISYGSTVHSLGTTSNRWDAVLNDSTAVTMSATSIGATGEALRTRAMTGVDLCTVASVVESSKSAGDFDGGNASRLDAREFNSAGSTYNVSTGSYIGSVSTTVDGSAVSGEYVEYTLDSPGYVYAFYLIQAYEDRRAVDITVAGLKDGTSTWTELFQQDGLPYHSNRPTFFQVTTSAAQTNAVSKVRLIVRKNGAGTSWTNFKVWGLFAHKTSHPAADTDNWGLLGFFDATHTKSAVVENLGVGLEGGNYPESALVVQGPRSNTPAVHGIHLGSNNNGNDYAIELVAKSASNAAFIDFTGIGKNSDYQGRILYTNSNDNMSFYANRQLHQTLNGDATTTFAGKVTAPEVLTDKLSLTSSKFFREGNATNAFDAVDLVTSTGVFSFGCDNNSYAHFDTNVSSFYFNKTVRVNGSIEPFTSGQSLGSSTRLFNAYLATLYVNGDATLGDAAADATNVKGYLQINGTTVIENDRDIVNVKNITFTGTASGNGSGLTALNASNLSSGTVAKERLPETLSSSVIDGSLSVTGNRRFGEYAIEYKPFLYDNTTQNRYFILETPVELLNVGFVGPYYVHVKMVPITEEDGGFAEFDINLYNGSGWDPYADGWFGSRSHVVHKGSLVPTIFTLSKGDPANSSSLPRLCVVMDFGESKFFYTDTVTYVQVVTPNQSNYPEDARTRALAGSPVVDSYSSVPAQPSSGTGFYNLRSVNLLSSAVHANSSGVATTRLVPLGNVTNDRLVTTNYTTGEIQTAGVRVVSGGDYQYFQTNETKGFWFTQIGNSTSVPIRSSLLDLGNSVSITSQSSVNSRRSFRIQGSSSAHYIDIQPEAITSFDYYLISAPKAIKVNAPSLFADSLGVSLSRYFREGDTSTFNAVELVTEGGTLGFGCANTLYAHFNTSTPGFYFNKEVIVNGDLQITSGTASGNGSGLTALNASNLSSGTVADARLPSTMAGKTFTGPVEIDQDIHVTSANVTVSTGFTSLTMSSNGTRYSGPYLYSGFGSAFGNLYLVAGAFTRTPESQKIFFRGASFNGTSGSVETYMTLDQSELRLNKPMGIELENSETSVLSSLHVQGTRMTSPGASGFHGFHAGMNSNDAALELVGKTNTSSAYLDFTGVGKDSDYEGRIRYSNSGNFMDFYTSKTARLLVNSSGATVYQNLDVVGGTLTLGSSTNSPTISIEKLHTGLTIENNNGYVRIGPQNTSYCHMYTDLPKFYIDKPVTVNGDVLPYSNNAFDLGSSTARWNAFINTLTVYGHTTLGDTSSDYTNVKGYLQVNGNTVIDNSRNIDATTVSASKLEATTNINFRSSSATGGLWMGWFNSSNVRQMWMGYGSSTTTEFTLYPEGSTSQINLSQSSIPVVSKGNFTAEKDLFVRDDLRVRNVIGLEKSDDGAVMIQLFADNISGYSGSGNQGSVDALIIKSRNLSSSYTDYVAIVPESFNTNDFYVGDTFNNFTDRTLDFTGQHTCYFEGSHDDFRQGMIVSTTGTYRNYNLSDERKYAPTIDQSLPVVTLSTAAKDKKSFGIISFKVDSRSQVSYSSRGIVGPLRFDASDNYFRINSLGEGAILVNNTNGPLENGDYITTSNVAGIGMRQDDDLLHNYTVAKITQDCPFEGTVYDSNRHDETYREAFVGCTYHCG